MTSNSYGAPVSILITAYNRPDYFKIALDSAINQTYKNIEIIICDNSTNEDCKIITKEYIKKYSNIKYYKNKTELTVVDNFKKCLKLSNGKYVSYLMDDDIYHNNKINRMVKFFEDNPDVSLVTSYRQLIDETGNNLPFIDATKKLCKEITFFQGEVLKLFVINKLSNIIGETTTPLFKRKDISFDIFGVYKGRQYTAIADVATWFTLLSKGKAVYIPEPLSYFRIHSSQDQHKTDTIIIGTNEWFYLLQQWYEDCKIKNSNNYKRILKKWIKHTSWVIKKITPDNNHKELNEQLMNNFMLAKNIIDDE
jgi:glycosyltransferase involved in cell wall biosynthesis